jgi:hypothetical protein
VTYWVVQFQHPSDLTDLTVLIVRYLDSNNISGILDISYIFSEQDVHSISPLNLTLLSLMNNSIVDVKYTTDNIKNQKTVVR